MAPHSRAIYTSSSPQWPDQTAPHSSFKVTAKTLGFLPCWKGVECQRGCCFMCDEWGWL